MSEHAIGMVHSFPLLFALAHNAAERSRDLRDQALAAVLFSAAAIEGFINAILHEIQISNSVDLPDSVRILASLASELDDRNASLTFKLQIFSAALTRKPLDKGSIGYHDLRLLFRIRDAIMHLRPEPILGAEADEHPIVRSLLSRGIIQMSKIEFRWSWIAAIHHPAVAYWAYRTAKEAARNVAEMFPTGWQERWIMEIDMSGEPLEASKWGDVLIPLSRPSSTE